VDVGSNEQDIVDVLFVVEREQPRTFHGITFEAIGRADHTEILDGLRHEDESDVSPQSFSLADVLYWIRAEPVFGRQAVFLDGANVSAELPSKSDLEHLADQGVRIWAPPRWALISSNNGVLVPSQIALDARSIGLDLITWTLERSGLLAGGNGGY
jgi:hypothetical protein